jgi:hypothetical protein
VVGALSYVLDILDYLKTGTMDGMVEPFRVYLVCYQVLRSAREPRALDVLREGHRRLQARAARITDEAMRSSFLTNVAAHRELVSQYQKLRQG